MHNFPSIPLNKEAGGLTVEKFEVCQTDADVSNDVRCPGNTNVWPKLVRIPLNGNHVESQTVGTI